MKTFYLPRVETKRLILRPVELNDAKDMYEYCSDEETVRLLSFKRHESVEETEATIHRFFLTKPQLGLPQAYAIVIKETGKMIGTIGFNSVIAGDNSEIGYVLNKAYWNQGYATEACHKLIEVGFKVLGLRRIYVRHHQENSGSKRVIEKCGFVYEGIQRQWRRNPDGSYSDFICYSLLAHEYDEMIRNEEPI